jgi:hypothetical protein
MAADCSGKGVTIFGFRVEAWERLAEALREHGRKHEVARKRQTGFGSRCVVEGGLSTPSGRGPRVRTVWQFFSWS